MVPHPPIPSPLYFCTLSLSPPSPPPPPPLSHLWPCLATVRAWPERVYAEEKLAEAEAAAEKERRAAEERAAEIARVRENELGIKGAIAAVANEGDEEEAGEVSNGGGFRLTAAQAAEYIRCKARARKQTLRLSQELDAARRAAEGGQVR